MPVDISDRRFQSPAPQEMSRRSYVVPLSSSCLLKVNKGSITKWSIDGRSDAIVNSTNELLFPGEGVDIAIHRAAGPKLKYACYDIPEIEPGVRCPTGEARITPGFKLPASRVIHAVGPIYFFHEHPEALLRNAYRNTMKLAKANNIEYIAFPALCCGNNGYPCEEAAEVAISTVREFANDFKEVHFVLLLDNVYTTWVNKINEYIVPILQGDNLSDEITRCCCSY